MDLTWITDEHRQELIQKRIVFIQETINGYSSLEDYARDKDEWFAVRGIALRLMDDCISLCNYIEYNDYYCCPIKLF